MQNMPAPTVAQNSQRARVAILTLISVAKEEKNVGYPLVHVFGTPTSFDAAQL